MDDSVKNAIYNILKTISGKYKIVPHENLMNDLDEILSGCGQVDRFLVMFAQRCTVLALRGKNATQGGSRNFERLKHVDIEMYSMHIKFEKNIRILYTFNGDTIIMFLCAFDERSGKRKTDYSGYIPTAKQRLKECLEGE